VKPEIGHEKHKKHEKYGAVGGAFLSAIALATAERPDGLFTASRTKSCSPGTWESSLGRITHGRDMNHKDTETQRAIPDTIQWHFLRACVPLW
jgi:hypothetical protein